ncbi:hypothetical protein KA977_06770 [Candidatus Dependentiae bacterium]|nr:hypothetical protein [Candidatus Dependentiae bacterium]
MKYFYIVFSIIILLCLAVYFSFYKKQSDLCFEWKAGDKYEISYIIEKNFYIENKISDTDFTEIEISDTSVYTRKKFFYVTSESSGYFQDELEKSDVKVLPEIELFLDKYFIKTKDKSFALFPFVLPGKIPVACSWYYKFSAKFFDINEFELISKLDNFNEKSAEISFKIKETNIKHYDENGFEYNSKLSGKGTGIFDLKTKFYSKFSFEIKIETDIFKSGELYQKSSITFYPQFKIGKID